MYIHWTLQTKQLDVFKEGSTLPITPFTREWDHHSTHTAIATCLHAVKCCMRCLQVYLSIWDDAIGVHKSLCDMLRNTSSSHSRYAHYSYTKRAVSITRTCISEARVTLAPLSTPVLINNTTTISDTSHMASRHILRYISEIWWYTILCKLENVFPKG